jgi:hypothetical protein
MPRNPTLRPHRAPSETINIALPEANKCRNCRHSIPSSQGLGERVTCLLFGETHPTFDHCCRWQTRD